MHTTHALTAPVQRATRLIVQAAFASNQLRPQMYSVLWPFVRLINLVAPILLTTANLSGKDLASLGTLPAKALRLLPPLKPSG
jgi:hypothetical protein